MKGTLDYIHFDLWGLMGVTSKGCAYYLLSIINDFSRKVWIFFLKKKSNVFATFKEWKTMIKKKTRKQVKCLHTYNGLEFC